MSQTERIRYRIMGYSFTEISKSKGSIEYHLMGDFGNERIVTAMAKLSMFKKVRSVSPIYHRELPLIEVLAEKKLNDSVIVDFSEYNKKHPRGSMTKQKISVPTEKMIELGTSVITNISSLLDHKLRLLPLLFFTIVGFIIISYLLSEISPPLS